MRTIREYEASDIDLKDEMHGLVAGLVLLAALSIVGKKKDPSETEADLFLKESVAQTLNYLEKSGYSIVKTETVPEVFRR